MTLTEFLLARLAEDETIARDWRHNRDKVEIHGGGTGYERLVNPDHVLADVEAKRAVLRLLDQIGGHYEPNSARVVPNIRRLLAAPYADHPDYDQEWTP